MDGKDSRYHLRATDNAMQIDINEKLRHLRQERGGYKSSITVKQKDIRELMSTSNDINKVKQKLDQLIESYKQFRRVHTQYIELIQDDVTEVSRALEYYAIVTEDFEEVQKETREWLERQTSNYTTETKTSNYTKEDSIRPEDSVSQTGKSSSSTSSLRLKARAQKAALLAQADSLRRRQELKVKQLELEQETERLTLDGQIKAAEAEEQVYEDYKSNSGVKRSRSLGSKIQLNPSAKAFNIPKSSRDTFSPPDQIKSTYAQERELLMQSLHKQGQMLSHLKVTMDNMYQQATETKNTYLQAATPIPENNLPYSPQINPQYTPSPKIPPQMHYGTNTTHHNLPHPTYHSSNSNPTSIPTCLPVQDHVYNNMNDTIINFQRTIMDTMHMPRAELLTFDGDPLLYWTFIRSFESSVDKTDLCATGKLTRLIQYCVGKAREVIKCCTIMEPVEGYTEAKRLLFERFGNPYTISRAWIGKITEGESLKPNNSQALRQFADDVRGCMLTLNAMGHLGEVDNQIRMVQIIEKLPYFLQTQWRKHAVRCLRESGLYPDISRLVDFIEVAAQEATDPVFGSLLPTNNSKEYTQKRHFPKKSGTVFSMQMSNRREQSSAIPSLPFNCHYCQQQHPLLKCEVFQELSAEKRCDFVKDNHLCFNCFSPKHWSNNCNKNSRCLINGCTKNHSKLLHEHLYRNTFNKVPERAQNRHVSLEGVAAHSEEIGVDHVALPTVRVKVKNVHGDYVETQALLDSGSTNTFCSDDFLRILGLPGHRTRLSLTTLANEDSQLELTTTSLHVTDASGRQTLFLPKVFATPHFPTLKDNVADFSDMREWIHLRDLPLTAGLKSDVNIIIGQDAPEALLPIEVRHGKPGEPYAIRTMLGWSLNGPFRGKRSCSIKCNFIQADNDLSLQVENFWKLDVCPDISKVNGNMSKDDNKVLQLWKTTTTQEDKHYQMRIPFRNQVPGLPNNYCIAESRLQGLGRKLSRDAEKLIKYRQEIENLVANGYAERVSDSDERKISENGKLWYLPHHGVTNVNKPGKLRIVFDCAATFCGISLNSEVLQGPDLTNTLLGVLLKFREYDVAVMGDIEAMFHQVKVHPEDRDVLRFLWWQDGEPNGQIETYRMTVHLFGGVWSPSCANFALKLTAEANKLHYQPIVSRTVQQNFYVDDCLKSIPTRDEAIQLVKDLCLLLNDGGFRLNKWNSNDRTVLESIPVEKRAKGVKDIDMDQSPLPVDRALGIQWNTEKDSFGYSIVPKERSFTRRGLLSIMSSVYDPLGFVSPFILLAKKIFQRETKIGKSWDSPLEEKNLSSWKVWLDNLPKLEKFSLPRHLIPPAFGEVVNVELHHFSDASCEGYGVTSYIRFNNDRSGIHCALVMAKSRLTPIKTLTIPRLELTAAVLATRMDLMLRTEHDICVNRSVFWTDSEIVLRYINNTDKRFQTFVSNRLSQIHETSSPNQWNYVGTKENPADDASRGLNADDLLASRRWKHGPEFLWKSSLYWPEQPSFSQRNLEDLEVKRETKVCSIGLNSTEDPVRKLLYSFSSWYKLKKAVSWILRLRKVLLRKDTKIPTESSEISIEELKEAEHAIIKAIQEQVFTEEMKDITSGHKLLKKTSLLFNLEPRLNDRGILCVGGRLQNSPASVVAKYQMIIPKDHHVGELLIRHYHEACGHSGKEFVLAEIRRRYWIVRARRQVERVLKVCVRCKRQHQRPDSQRMADLPVERVTPFRPPFVDVGVDCFGPFLVKRGRSLVKRYGCLFTCLTIRAIHIEKLDSLSTDSFINALKRFESRRGRPECLRSDNGTNFTSAQRELREGIKAWNQSAIIEHLRQKEIHWMFNPPSASHMGGVWERQIRTVRKVLNSILPKQSGLDDEGLCTLFCEVEAIVNNRPITVVSDDPRDADPLTPSQLLLLRSTPVLPPGVFTVADIYSKQWRHVQQLSNLFWKRWIREYLPCVQFRQKWLPQKRNLCVDDVVLVLEENSLRGNWPLGRVVCVHPGKDGLVRSVDVKTRGSVLTRPVNKLCLLESVPD